MKMCIIRFMIESKFISLDKISEKTEWLQSFLDDILY